MAGPSIVVRVLGDLKGLASAFDGAGKTAASATSRIHGAFSTVLGQLNASGILGPFGESLSSVDEALDKVAGHGKTIGTVMLGVGGALAGVGVGLQAIGSKDQAAHQQLQAAITATGHDYDDYAEKVDNAIKTQEKFGTTANTTQDALRILTQAMGDPAKALDYLSTAANLAAAKHEDLATAAGQLGKAYNGAGKILKDYGLTAAPKATTATKALETATNQATAADDSAAKAKQRLSDLQARLGAGNTASVVSTTAVANAQAALAKAEQHVGDVAAEQAAKRAAGDKLTVADSVRLRDANQAVTTAQSRLTTATAAHTAAQDKANRSAGLTVSQQQQLRNAQTAVTEATTKATAAHQKMTAAQQLAKQAATGQTDTMDALAKKLSGQASAAADTFTGKLSAIKAHLEDSAATLGQKYGPAITAAGAAMTGLGAVIETTTAVTKALAASETLSAIAEMGMLAPILLLIAAIAALGVAAYLIYRNWSTIWNGMKAAVEFVWLWIKQNWPLLLAIILGPIAVAALEIAKHWNDIKAGAGAVITWFRTVWSTVTGYITAPFVSAWQAIARGWDTVVGVVAGIPGQIGRIASGMWGSILGAFRAMVNGIIDIWNGLHFTLPKINEGPIHIGGETIGVPRIPHLAQGGLITGTGLIYAHAGEAITPAADVGPRGPAVVVQQAVFNSGVDVDAFMRMAAWRVQTSRV